MHMCVNVTETDITLKLWWNVMSSEYHGNHQQSTVHTSDDVPNCSGINLFPTSLLLKILNLY